MRPKSPLPARFPNDLCAAPWPRVQEEGWAAGRGCFWRFLQLSGAQGAGPGEAAAIAALPRAGSRGAGWAVTQHRAPGAALLSTRAARPDPDSAARPRRPKGDSALAGSGAHALAERAASLAATKCSPFAVPGAARLGWESWRSELGKLRSSLPGAAGFVVSVCWGSGQSLLHTGESKHGSTGVPHGYPAFTSVGGKQQMNPF